MKTKEIKTGKFEANYLIADLKMANVNRDIFKKHCDRFKLKLEKYGWLMPIVVSESGDVIEGHHRIEAAKSMNLKTVPAYIVSWVNTKEEKDHLDCIISLNNGNKAWNKLDYLKAFSESNKDYKIVYQAYKSNSHNVSVGNVINCYFRKSKLFKTGESKIKNKQFAEYLIIEISKLYTDFPDRCTAYCVREFINISYIKAEMNKEFVSRLFREYRKICKNSPNLASSIKDFRPFMETQLTLIKADLKK